MAAFKIPKQKEIKRYATVFNVLAKYGFEDVLVNSGIAKMIPKSYLGGHPDTKKNLSLSTYERIRMVLEELGPSYVKLGQIFSNREDMLPPELVKELEKLQDHAPNLKNFDVQKAIETELNRAPSDCFLSIEPEPLAAASLAQVHRARLLNGDDVVLKIQRPNIEEVIESDLMIMKQVAKALEKHSTQAQAFQPVRIIDSFEQSIGEELQFLREMDNTEKFAKNFEGNEMIHVPKVYRQFSTNRLICMEYIDGIKVSETDRLKAANISPSAVAKVGVDLYLEQILEHGFFHADPHPGNIFVLPDEAQICFLDFGMMGTVLPSDKEALGDLLLHFMRKDVKKTIHLLEKIAVKTDIPDQKKLEQDLYGLIEGVSNTAIQNIKVGPILNRFKTVLYENRIILPHYMYMLIRGIIIIEGVGRRLDPEFNITANLEPYTSKIISKRFSLKRLFKKNLNRLQDFNNLVDTLPEDINSILKKIKDGKLVVVHEHKGLKEFHNATSKSVNRLVFAVIIAALSIGSSILVMAQMPPLINGIPLLGAIGFVLSAILGFYIVISIFRNDQF
ncbi:ABC1 kinase family protein [Pseudozobellia thermophila]|uniref:Ubiquinone biosynthesis protein n=1 Tax=Pseudozobellia thermophila TaxID=192903 RepID=A0A1M6GCF9_9FLAO|nr:AarF/ABC1/UbiB kinase family protein [Pseudozobellia thermophila]SHJ07596.1 ubiquinone biosynthesis protein [Pseudozobellia thermophila]